MHRKKKHDVCGHSSLSGRPLEEYYRFCAFAHFLVCGLIAYNLLLWRTLGNEAHGGYAFCGLATVAMLGTANIIDVPRLLVCATNAFTVKQRFVDLLCCLAVGVCVDILTTPATSTHIPHSGIGMYNRLLHRTAKRGLYIALGRVPADEPRGRFPRSVTHTLTSVMRPMWCMVLNILT